MEILNSLYKSDGKERVGFILEDNEIVEVMNISMSPEDSFMIRTEDILNYNEIAIATWHTHPNASSNLSHEDLVLIRNWPNLIHYIVGNDGVQGYTVDKELNTVMKVKHA